MKHTYQLIEAIISKEARVQKHEKEENLCVPFSLLSRLDESPHKVSLQLITIDYTVKAFFFLTPRTIKISSICRHLLLYWLPSLRF